MRIALLVALSLLAVVTVLPAPAAADPFDGSCDYIHWHKGSVLNGEPPLWPHWHPCL